MDERTLARIRLVSRRYGELRGLRTVALGAGVAVPFGLFFVSGSDSDVWFFTATFIAVLLALVTRWWAGRYYEAEFGRVVPAQSGQARGILLGVSFGMSGIVVQDIFGDSVQRLWPFVWTAPFLLWIAIRDWPWRTHHLLTAAAFALAPPSSSHRRRPRLPGRPGRAVCSSPACPRCRPASWITSCSCRSCPGVRYSRTPPSSSAGRSEVGPANLTRRRLRPGGDDPRFPLQPKV